MKQIAVTLLFALAVPSCSNTPAPSSGSDQPVGKPGWKAQTVYEALPPDRPAKGLDDAKVQQALAGESKPNIVLIMMDNVGWGEIGTYGGGILRGAETRRIDSLATEGMKLLNYNVEPQCTPSRSATMTGRFAIRSGTTHVVWGMLYGLTQWEVTVAEVLSNAGYATAMYGKWHLGDIQGRLPNDQGFDEWFGIPNTTDESLYKDGFQYDPKAVPLPIMMEGKKGDASKKVGDYDVEARRRIDGQLTDRAIAFMKKAKADGKPFFVFLPYTQAHLPTLPHPDFDGKTGNGHYADVLAEMDHRAGQVLDAIDEIGAREDTIVIWTSDNGPEQVNPHQGTSGYWRGTYFTALEGSLRVPFLVRWPGRIPAGAVSNEIVHTVDLLPTLARVAGAKPPTDRMIDGVDQLPFLLAQQQNSNREDFPVYNGPEMFAFKWRNWKLHFVSQDTMLSPVSRSVVPKLYNLLTDPKEEYNLISHAGAEKGAWVMPPIFKRRIAFEASLQAEPPIPLGTPDPYVPSRR